MTYGRTKSDRQGYFLSGYWNASDTVKLNAFGSWEEAKYPSNHRYIGTVAGGPTPPSGYCTLANPNCYDPFAAPNRQQLLQLELADQGQDVDGRRGRRLAGDGRAQADGLVPVHQRTRAPRRSACRTTSRSRRRRFRSTTSTTASSSIFNLKGIWSYNRNWSFTGGYSYLKYKPQRHRHRRVHVRAAGRHEHRRRRHRSEQSEQARRSAT